MKVTRKETTNPRSRQKVKYDIQGLTAEEFNTLCKALELVKDIEPGAASLYKTFTDIKGGIEV